MADWDDLPTLEELGIVDDEPTDEELWIAPSLRDSYIILQRVEQCWRCLGTTSRPWPQSASGACSGRGIEPPPGYCCKDIMDLTYDQQKELGCVFHPCQGEMRDAHSRDQFLKGAGTPWHVPVCGWLKACESCGWNESEVGTFSFVTCRRWPVPLITDACIKCHGSTLKPIGIHKGQMSLILWKRHVAAVICARSKHFQAWTDILSFI